MRPSLAGAISAAGGEAGLPEFSSVVGFGDSITAGSLASDAAHQWLNIVATAVGAGSPLNQGVGGTVLQNSNDSGGSPRANNGRDRFSAALLGGNKRELCIIAYGFNDARYTAAPSTFNLTQFGNDYREVLNGLIIGGYAANEIIIVSPYYITDTGLNTGSAGFTGQTRAVFEDFVDESMAVARDFGTYSIDIYSYMLAAGGGTLISGDDIHPGDPGHAVIAAGVLTATIANSRAKPTAISGQATGQDVTVSLTPPAGSVSSYEYELISSSVVASTSTTGTFTGVANGTYYIKARAVFSDASKSPWAFSASTVVVAAPAVTFLSDTFTDTTGTELTSHTPETGGPWVVQSGYSPSSAALIDASGMVYCRDTQNVYHGSTVAPSPDYYVEAVFTWLSNLTSDNVGICGRMQASGQNLYFVRFSRTTSNWDLFKTVAGVNTNLGSYNQAFTSGTRTVRLSLQGTSIKAFIDGTERISVTDSALSGAGYAGARLATVQASTTGIHIDSIVASTFDP